MRRSHFVRVAVVSAAAMMFTSGRSVCAQASAGIEALKKHGVAMAGSIAVADLEADVKNKLAEARTLARELGQSLMEQQGMVSPKERERNIKALNDQINQLKSEISSVNEQMGQIPRSNAQLGGGPGSGYGGGGLGLGFGGRLGAGNVTGYNGAAGGTNFANNYDAEQYSELLAYRNQLQEELKEGTRFLDEIQFVITDPKAKEKLESEIKKGRESYRKLIVELRKLVDATTAKYGELAKNNEVAKALKLVGKGQREKPKLGPTREFLSNVKVIEKLEKAEANGEILEPPAIRSKRGRGRTRGKTSTSSKPAATRPAAQPAEMPVEMPVENPPE